MNEIQRRLNCLICYKYVQCLAGANVRLKRHEPREEIKYYSPGVCKAFLLTETALALIGTESKIIRDFKEEVLQNYINKLSDEQIRIHTICKRTGKLGQIGFGMSRGVDKYEYSFLGRVVGSWSQRGSSGYYVRCLETKRYRKVPSFKTLEEESN